MKSIKYFLPLIVLFLSIGYAATNVTLSITGDVITKSDIEDFDVYISDIKVDGVTDVTLLVDDKSFSYYMAEDYTSPLQTKTIQYTITNNSSSFDAQILIECTEENIGLSNEIIYKNKFETSEENNINQKLIISKGSENAEITFERNGPTPNGLKFTCSITAEPIERKELGVGETPDKIEPPKIKYFDSDASGYIDVGDVVDISGEKFNIISADSQNVTMFAQLTLGTNYRQSETENNIVYATESGWEYTPGPKEVDVNRWLPNIAIYTNQYKDYLNSELKEEAAATDLITVKQLISLGYNFEEDYSNSLIRVNPGDNWVETNQSWYTKSAVSSMKDVLHWYSYYDHYFNSPIALGMDFAGVRPTVTIAYPTFKELSKTPKKSLISFTIDGTSYQGVEGMTWGEWVNSEYNTAGFYITNNSIRDADGELEINYGATPVSASQKIGIQIDDNVFNWAYRLWPA